MSSCSGSYMQGWGCVQIKAWHEQGLVSATQADLNISMPDWTPG